MDRSMKRRIHNCRSIWITFVLVCAHTLLSSGCLSNQQPGKMVSAIDESDTKTYAWIADNQIRGETCLPDGKQLLGVKECCKKELALGEIYQVKFSAVYRDRQYGALFYPNYRQKSDQFAFWLESKYYVTNKSLKSKDRKTRTNSGISFGKGPSRLVSIYDSRLSDRVKHRIKPGRILYIHRIHKSDSNQEVERYLVSGFPFLNPFYFDEEGVFGWIKAENLLLWETNLGLKWISNSFNWQLNNYKDDYQIFNGTIDGIILTQDNLRYRLLHQNRLSSALRPTLINRKLRISEVLQSELIKKDIKDSSNENLSINFHVFFYQFEIENLVHNLNLLIESSSSKSFNSTLSELKKSFRIIPKAFQDGTQQFSTMFQFIPLPKQDFLLHTDLNRKKSLDLDRQNKALKCSARIQRDVLKLLLNDKRLIELKISNFEQCKYLVTFSEDLNRDGYIVKKKYVYKEYKGHLKQVRASNALDKQDRFFNSNILFSWAWIPFDQFIFNLKH